MVGLEVVRPSTLGPTKYIRPPILSGELRFVSRPSDCPLKGHTLRVSVWIPSATTPPIRPSTQPTPVTGQSDWND